MKIKWPSHATTAILYYRTMLIYCTFCIINCWLNIFMAYFKILSTIYSCAGTLNRIKMNSAYDHDCSHCLFSLTDAAFGCLCELPFYANLIIHHMCLPIGSSFVATNGGHME